MEKRPIDLPISGKFLVAQGWRKIKKNIFRLKDLDLEFDEWSPGTMHMYHDENPYDMTCYFGKIPTESQFKTLMELIPRP